MAWAAELGAEPAVRPANWYEGSTDQRWGSEL
uniref:Uncharacterized protein n=1 Tax=Arundo donax TaxID=35708 RepID=A0A0A9AD52_ARUDO